jgi:hypothetical protein
VREALRLLLKAEGFLTEVVSNPVLDRGRQQSGRRVGSRADE